jgi:hypothetical protein
MNRPRRGLRGIVRPLAMYGIVLDASMLEWFFGVPAAT